MATMTATEEKWQPQVIIRSNNDANEDPSASDLTLALSPPKPFWQRALLWYIAPLCWDIKYSGKTVLYQMVNFALAWTCFIYTVVAYAVSGAFVVFIFGILLLWVMLEFSILLARFDILVAYYLVERELQAPVKLALHVRHLPPCVWMTPISSFWERFKFLVTSCATYVLLLYQVVVKMPVTMIFSMSMLPIMWLLWGMGLPFWYASNPRYFRETQVCLFGQTGNPKKVDPCHPYMLHINNFGAAFGVFLVCWALFPLALRFNSFCANILKIVTYYFLSDHFAGDSEKSEQASLIPREPVSHKPTKGAVMSTLDDKVKYGRDSDDDLL